ncbi:MAG TPA: tetratricopeptide repeat protein, partial [Vicinamibacteria bacterium]|nr:tetratricopeptide repeat protein [Vicinamibacteria bacterium]
MLEGLARALWDGGDFQAAEATYRDAIRHRHDATPESLTEAAGWGFLGELLGTQSDHEGAMAAYRQALALREAQAPDSLWTAVSLIGLGNNSTDPAAGEEFYGRAAAIAEGTVPDGPTMSAALMGSGNVAEVRGDLAAAERFWKRSLAIDEKLNPA